MFWGRKINIYRRVLRSRNGGCFLSDKPGGIFGCADCTREGVVSLRDIMSTAQLLV